MMRDMEANESFCSCISSRRKIRESVSSLLDRTGPHVIQDVEKANVLTFRLLFSVEFYGIIVL